MQRVLIPLAAVLACGGAPARAGTAAGADEAGSTIVITAANHAASNKTSSSATRTPTELRNIPQALTIISSARIAEQQLRSVGDLLLYVPGASYGSGEGNRDQLVLRGNSSTADFFVDGMRDDVQYFRDFYNVERVDVLNGPNAMIFGRGGGGGVVNRILKQPSLTSHESAAMSTDSWGALRFTLDANQPLSPVLGLRLNALYEDSSTFRRHVSVNRYGLNPTVALVATPDTRVDVGYEHFHDRRTVDRGVPADGNAPLVGFTRSFFGDATISFSNASVDVANLSVEQQLGNAITLKTRAMFGDYRKFYQNIFPSSYNRLTSLVALSGYNNSNNRTSGDIQSDLVWNARVAGVEQTILFGIDVEDEQSRNRHMTASFISGASVPLSNPTETADVVFTPLASDANNRVRTTLAAVYAQDQIRPTQWFEIIGGLRLDRLTISVDDLRAVGGGRFGRTDMLVSPRLGVVLKPTDPLSVYASLSRSFLPQSGDQFSSLTSITEALKPERFDNHELGIKLELPRGILATAAIYQLDRTNTRATDPANPALIVLTGAQQSRGLELGLSGKIAPYWEISAGYSLQNAEITRTTTAASAGNTVPLVPHQSFSVWNRLQLSNAAGVGMGVISRSKSYATVSNAVELPGYTRIDASLYFKLMRGFDAQLNLENLLGVHYFPTANADNNIIPGAPRTLRATLRYGL